MAEAQKDIAAQRDQLLAENEQLRAQLAAAGAAGATVGRAAVPAHQFMLSEGDRAALEQNGWASINGKVMSIEDVRAALGPDQQSVPLVGPENPTVPQPPQRGSVRGVDFVYPSVAPGEIDPAVAGTPGVSGPAAKEA